MQVFLTLLVIFIMCQILLPFPTKALLLGQENMAAYLIILHMLHFLVQQQI